jgi:copper transport protein
LLAAGGLVLAVVVGWAAPALAHAQLQSTDPAAGAVLGHSPGRVTVRFGEPVEIQFGAIRVFNATAKRVDSGASYHPGGDNHAVAENVPATLPAGGYVVTWRVVSADSHPVHGAFTFRIGTTSSAANASDQANAARLLSSGGGSAVVGGLFWMVRFLGFASLLILLGAAAFVAAAWPAGAAEARVRRLLWATLGGAVVTTGLSIALQGTYAGGLPLVDAAKPSVLTAVLHTRYGEVYAGRLAILLLAWRLLHVLLAEGPARSLPAWWQPAGAAAAIAVLLATALAGHAGAGSQVGLAVALDLVHLGAAAVWLGGLAIMAVAVLPAAARPAGAADDGPAGTVLTFSRWAFGAVMALVLSAAYLAWRQVGTLAAVTGTTYGRLLLAKTIAFGAMIGLASLSRRAVRGGLALPVRWRAGTTRRRPVRAVSPGPGAMASDPARGRAVRLRRAVLGELLIGAVVLALTALLVNAQPARAALARPFATEVKAGDRLLVDVVVDPARAGPLTLHIYVLDTDGAPADVPDVRAALTLPGAGVEPIQVPLRTAGTGHFLVSGLDVPIKGTWTLLVAVRTGAIDEVNAEPIKVPIE